MYKKSSKEYIENFKLSREYVNAFTFTYSNYFEKPITIESLKEFCRSVEVNLKKSPFGSQVPGRLESRVEGDRQIVDVFYSANLDSIPKYSAIMHEIGHWFLLKTGNGLGQKDLWWRENFANNFSNLVCIPFYNRFNVVKSLFTANKVDDIRKIITNNGIKLNISTLLKTLNFEIRNDLKYLSLLSSNLIWISVKLMPKKGSTIEPKFRILSALYDFTKYYVPDQTRISNLITDINSKFDISIGETATFDTTINLFSIESYNSAVFEGKGQNRFFAEALPCTVQVLRLRRNPIDNLTSYLLLIQIN
jgi:predicted RNA methylase